MKQRTLGRTGIQVSEISFGGVEIGIPYGIGIQSQADMPSDAEAMNLLHAALDCGINFFDTARAYGRSEEIIGMAFKGKRESAVICTKCGRLLKENGQLPHPEQIRAMIDRSLQASLSALQTDYLDVFMLHSADLDTLHNETVAGTFLELKEKGHIRATGVSTYTVEETILAIEKGIWDIIQLSFNLMDQRQAEHFDHARAAGVGLMVRSVLLKGILSDRGRNLHPALKAVEDHRNLYQNLLGPATPTLSTLATKFALSYSQVASVLVGMDRMAYLHQAVATANGGYLDAELLVRAEKLAFPNPEFIDLPKWDRMGWLK
jgi:1-deoxyxylulose-5-phosphate synthase